MIEFTKHILFIILILIMSLITLITITKTHIMSPWSELSAIITVSIIIIYERFIKNSRERK